MNRRELEKEKLRLEVKVLELKDVLADKYLKQGSDFEEFTLVNVKSITSLTSLRQELAFVLDLLEN